MLRLHVSLVTFIRNKQSLQETLPPMPAIATATTYYANSAAKLSPTVKLPTSPHFQ